MPQLRPSIVHRPRLNKKLSAALQGKLTLICAPAGFGKTTLVVDFLRRMPGTTWAWFAIDEQDNDPMRFLAYLLAAVHTQWPNASETAIQALRSPQPPTAETVLTEVINGMAAQDEQLILVLDDYHLIEIQAVHQMLAFILEHQPPALHLIVSTRADPLLPLARLRARGQMIELRKDGLRFTTAEATHFLNQVMNLDLSANLVHKLEQQTEGWIAGLQLAALSMQNRQDIPGFINSFSGTHRFILDYLADEVLNQRPQGTREFLLRTSILERLSAPLCNALTGRENGQTILEQLEQANLFTFPLDDSRQWFRYHRLFAELLRHKLRVRGEPPLAELHRRAGTWFEQHDYTADAIHHALAAEDWGRAARLIGQATDSMLKGGQAITLIEWCRQLPPGLLDAVPDLGLTYTWALLLTGRLSEAARTLNKIAAQMQKTPELLGHVAAAQAYLAREQGDHSQVITQSQLALSLLPQDDWVARGNITLNLGLVYWHEGRLSEAEEILKQALPLTQATGNQYGELAAQIFLARTLASKGNLSQAEKALQAIVATGSTMTIVSLAYYDLAALAYEWNHLDRSLEYVERGLALSRRGGHLEFENGGHLQRAFTLLAQNDAAGAREEAETVRHLSQKFNPATQARSAALQIHIALVLGDLETAVQWADRLQENMDAHSLYRFLGLALPRLLIAQDKKEAAARRLEQCYVTAVRHQWGYGLIATRVLQSLAATSSAQAQQYLVEALHLARPERYIRTFADQGAPLRRLLLASPVQAVMPDYFAMILEALSSAEPSEQETPSTGAPVLIEPLSNREMEILQLLAQRQSNAEIALILDVSVNTIKTHLQHIYEKLGVHNRKSAVATARDLRLIN